MQKGIVQKTDHTFLGKWASWSLYQLQPKFIASSIIPEIKLASSLQWEDLKKYNIIFVGSFKTIGILRIMPPSSRFPAEQQHDSVFSLHPRYRPDCDGALLHRHCHVIRLCRAIPDKTQ